MPTMAWLAAKKKAEEARANKKDEKTPVVKKEKAGSGKSEKES
jgi:hypothetical protein